ncbi:metal-dependent hydrolase [Gordonia spumicola]|nr:metal-dependent hydrolase [Gordonia spumicola]
MDAEQPDISSTDDAGVVDFKAAPIRARRIKFSYPQGSMNRHYVSDDLIMSHVVSMLSSVFPEGEDFFIRSVKYYKDEIANATLRAQVDGFIGQEATHGREHREINEHLQEMGYPTRINDRLTKRALAMIYRHAPHKFSLAMTAGLEHYTATLASLLLTNTEARALLTSDEVRGLLLWHAYEEVEHKAVAFDVYRTIGGSEALRIGTMRGIHITFLGLVTVSTLASMLTDRATYNPARLLRSVAAMRTNPWINRDVLRELGTYTRRGFHPSDNPTDYLLKTWRSELFGDQGILTDNLVGGRQRRSDRC